MKRKTIVIGLSAATLASALAIGGVALANGVSPERVEADDVQEIAAVMGARVSLVQAVAIAERQNGGKALEAAFDDESGSRWEVELARDGQVSTYLVDMTTGALSAAPGESETDEGSEDED
ncbi:MULTISPECIES: PepSY domain-containing protein [unclassified Brevundimonas]|jgi:hypothetical protein|uniref:PepSY domain-containing protein n=1 Tax=unclassified Brevundimonas TaxID=2622653 RepID=UPI0012A8B2F5|nr:MULTISPECIES: PepSY domain-containing protein [unclassified Brevundimonas]MCG2663828.1 PepSY domain-containing protein [Brevundimonas sp.]QFU32391.1 hypothetical protein BSP_12035 [Brevundimonas sp. Bb-A]